MRSRGVSCARRLDRRGPVCQVLPSRLEDQSRTTPVSVLVLWSRTQWRATAFYSTEQELKLALFEIGPLIAMAEPDKPDPVDPGAARMRLHENAWQEEVGEEMSSAALVIMRIGHSDGFWWELREAPKRVKPERLVLLLRPKDEQLYERVRERMREWLPCELPKYKPAKWPFADRGGVVYFESDWTPHLQKLKTAWLRQMFWNVYAPVLKIGLRPV